MALPCKHEDTLVSQVTPTVDLLSNLDEWHPDILEAHQITPVDYKSGLVFRSAIESIRGTYISSSTTSREALVQDVLKNLKERGLIRDFQKTGNRNRFDFAVNIDHTGDYNIAIETKGGEGNSINISDRPLWAREFYIWSHLDGAIVNQPAHGAHSIINRITNEFVRNGKLVDALIFKDVLCETRARPCPKYLGNEQGIGMRAAPDIFLFPLEAALANRKVIANDLSPYAYTLTRGKLEAPSSLNEALERVSVLTKAVEKNSKIIDTSKIPAWVKSFFHPKTLEEIVAYANILKREGDYFLLSCLLGILHHVRPGFLSYPASHLVPYLRVKKYPKSQYPKMYEYRDVHSKLVAKVRRAYKRTYLPSNWSEKECLVLSENAMALSISDHKVDAIVSSPPYFGALDYARDNRLRLYFLGCENWKDLDASLTANNKIYLPQMRKCLSEMHRVLKPSRYCILVLGDVDRNGKTRRTAEILGEMAISVTPGGFRVVEIVDDKIPDIRRSRRNTKTTKFERILVLQKSD